MIATHILGFPRMGAQRELKFALEAYWRGETQPSDLERVGRELRARHWALQREAELDWVTVGDFAFYDHVANHIQLLGCEPTRFAFPPEEAELDRYFTLARGRAARGTEPGAAALEMTKWFDTNYHYLVPEWTPETCFQLGSQRLFEEVAEAQALGHPVKVALLGPLTFLWLGKVRGPHFHRLSLLERLLPVYGQILARLKAMGVTWVQLDEPILGLELPPEWRQAFEPAYARLTGGPQLLLATYFSPLQDQLNLACRLPVQGLHIDAVRAPEEVATVADWLPAHKVLSLGLIDGRNIWRCNPDGVLETLGRLQAGPRRSLWLAPSCSLLHVPLDVTPETALDGEVKSWLAFAQQKLEELSLLATAMNQGEGAVAPGLAAARAAWASRQASSRVHQPWMGETLARITPAMGERQSPYPQRAALQASRLALPLFPTTTIGSFPQTKEIRHLRREFRAGHLGESAYREGIRQEIAYTVRTQEALGLDVLVHGEGERNDMVEYFGEQLEGFAFSGNGWVQSYGSRCVKPPILFGDVYRPRPMTVEWITYAASLTEKPMKGMLTGPVTILNWSFVRDDQPRAVTCRQIALAIREEVQDLEGAGIPIIQIDEAALREGLPLRRSAWQGYLDWAVDAYRLAANGVEDRTQIHTHMCYSEFNDIIAAIARMDADVITIETSRSHMELLEAFENFRYPNAIGPGVYDIHSPRIPTREAMEDLINRAAQRIPRERLWVNPDCGLKTRQWQEVLPALVNMVAAARELREQANTCPPQAS